MRLAILAAAIGVLALLGAATSDVEAPAALASGETQGDVNCSTTINSVDALQVLRHAAGLSTNAPCMVAAGNTNCDASINAVDALRILRHSAALTNTTPQGCTPIGDTIGPPEPSGPTSYALIDQALANGEIDAETALIYKAFAAWGDSRLPAEYAGDDVEVQENPIVRKIAAAWDGLSQETQDTLLPFLKTPVEPDSWYNLPTASARTSGGYVAAAAPAWDYVDATAPVRFWYHPSRPGAEAKAELLALEMDIAIWGDITGLMQKVPVPDCGSGCQSGGGSTRLDIYISGTPIRAYTQWNPPATTTCENTPSFIVLDQGDSAAIAAHEFMHAVQFAFSYAAGDGCTEPDWWWEATAQWAIDYVYPTGSADGPPHEEQAAAPDMLNFPDKPLEFSNDDHEYGAYLLAFFVAHQYGKPEFVRLSFEQMATDADSLSALDKALAAVGQEGFKKVWHEFTVQNWNQEPVDDYKQWDTLTKTAALEWTVPFEVNLTGSLDYANQLDELKAEGLEHLSAGYYHFKFTDDSVRTVIFNNGWSNELNEEVDPLLGTRYQAKDSSDPDSDKVKVQALVKIGGQWQGPEDWSALHQRHFCRDKIGERIEELVLVFSNAQFTDRNKTYKAADKPPTLWTSNMACWKWTGLVTFDGTVDGVTTTMTGNITLENLPQSWYATGIGDIDWNISGIDSGGCIHTGSDTVSIDTDATYLRYLVTFNNYTAGNFHRGYEAFGYAAGQVTEDISCPDGEGGWDEFQSIYDLGMWLQGQSDVAFKVGQGGDQIDGVFIDLGGGNARWEWHLNAQRE